MVALVFGERERSDACSMINFACRHYKAAKPCSFNKIDGSECPSCRHVSEFEDRILFIKLDAIGDVLRSASLLPLITQRHRKPYIAWLTRRESVELVRMITGVDETIELSETGLARALTGGWQYVYSLSNDMTSAALATMIPCDNLPIGFFSRGGVIAPSNPAAERWLEMAAFDRLKQANTQTYQQRMAAIIGHEGPVPAPALAVSEAVERAARERMAGLFSDSSRRRLAVNVGSGARWPKKMLDVGRTADYIQAAQKTLDVDVMLVGGEAEIAKSDAIKAQFAGDDSVQLALTPESIPAFVATLMQSDTLFCGDTLALHIASAIDLPTVAIFGPTSAPEIPDFDGLVAKTWTRDLDCLGCYGDCGKASNCMTQLDMGQLVSLTAQQLSRARRNSSSALAASR
jgi:ADP-heptose:LPS heptosyltransferase